MSRALLVREAATLHQQGKLDDAARRYAVILSGDPHRFDVLHRFGVLRAQEGKLVEAEALLRRKRSKSNRATPKYSAT